jgi:choloylglycine hydrolase
MPFQIALLAALALTVNACSDAMLKFADPNLRLSIRTLDLGSTKNWTITSWPAGSKHLLGSQIFHWESKYSTLGLTANWFGDEHWGAPSFFGDSLNEHGLSCSLLTLVDTQYEDRSDSKTNIFAGVFCHWAAQMFTSVAEVQTALDNVAIWGPDLLAQHFVLRDATGTSLVVECVGGKKQVYLDNDDGVNTFGIMTNEPTFDYHLMNIKHYEWKRTLARQAVAIPGNYYPEERYLRIHMVKSGMKDLMNDVNLPYQTAISLAAQVLNTVTVPMGDQYGTDSGSVEGDGDHSVFGLIRDHGNKIIYWRDSSNPSLRRLRLSDVFGDGSKPADNRMKSMKLQTGPYYVDMSREMNGIL